MYDFDKVVDRRGTSSIKWNFQNSFGQQSGLLPYWIADTDFATAPEVVQALQKRCDHPVIGYSKPLPGVYTAIQGWWDRRHGWKPETDWMLLSYGVVTGIYFTLDTVVPKGEKVLTFTPVYDPFFAAIKNSGHTLVDCPLDHKDNYYTINWELLEKELANGVKAVVFCNPHNPIGRVWTEEEMEKLVELCVKYNVYLLSDEIHCDFGFTRPCTTAGKFPQIYDKLVVYTAISKTFNMAGLGDGDDGACLQIVGRRSGLLLHDHPQCRAQAEDQGCLRQTLDVRPLRPGVHRHGSRLHLRRPVGGRAVRVPQGQR